MAPYLFLLALVALAVLGARFGADSRHTREWQVGRHPYAGPWQSTRR